MFCFTLYFQKERHTISSEKNAKKYLHDTDTKYHIENVISFPIYLIL